MKLVCIGDLGVDRYLPENKLLPGGITANFTRQARRAFDVNDEVHIISQIGTDKKAADLALNAVNIPGIDCHIETTDGETPVQYIRIKENGEKDFFKYDRGILKNFKMTKIQLEVLTNADLVMTPVYWQIYNIFELVLSANINGKTAVDFSDFATDSNFDLLNKYINKIDIAFFGLSNDQEDLIEQLSLIAKHNNKLFIITLGEHGSLAFKGCDSFQCDAVPVDNVIDTTGAGDAFAAGFLSDYSHGVDIQTSLQKGAIVAAKTIEHFGSVPA